MIDHYQGSFVFSWTSRAATWNSYNRLPRQARLFIDSLNINAYIILIIIVVVIIIWIMIMIWKCPL